MFVACWWARAIVESTATSQLISPAASALVNKAVRTSSHVPSAAKQRWRFHTVCHGPNSAGRSRQAIPVR